MGVTVKKLGQTALDTTPVTICTGVAGGHTEVKNLFITNTNPTTERKVKLFAHGTATGNTLIEELIIPAKGTKIFTKEEIAIVLPEGESLSALQDVGTDVIVTAYGIEEV
mgnify:CR=1 FL=1